MNPQAALSLAVFGAAEHCCAIESHELARAVELNQAQPEIPTIESLLGLAPTPGARYLLELQGGRQLQVGGPLRLLSLELKYAHPLPPLLKKRLQLPGLAALALPPAGGLILLLAPEKLPS